MNISEDTNSIYLLPYSKVVGHENLKMALEIAYIAGARRGGVLVSGHRGTGKSTTVRAFAKMMYGTLPVTIPINATEDRIVGGYKVDALMQGMPELQDGLLKAANGKILYIDEVNLLDDHIVNIILDTAASGHLSVQRQGIDIPDAITHFSLVGTMNPEEGYLRPQLRDRFGLMAHIITEAEHRAAILETVLAFDATTLETSGNRSFIEEGLKADSTTSRKLNEARQKQHSIGVSAATAEKCIALATYFDVVGHRADYFLALAARAQAARHGKSTVDSECLRDVAPLVLTHRRKKNSERWQEDDNVKIAEILDVDVESNFNLSPTL